MKILWHSNAPYAPTGYGNQTGLFAPLLAEEHELAISCYYGLEGQRLTWEGIPLLPGMGGTFGNEFLHQHARSWFGGNVRDGLVITLMDVWVLDTDMAKGLNMACWVPVDHEPAPPGVTEFFIKSGAIPIAMSKFGHRLLGRLDPLYVPHGVDTKVLRPYNRRDMRRETGVPEDAFLIGMVAANKGRPSRKGFQEAFQAFKLFRELHDNAFLYLHTSVDPRHANGEDIPALLESLDIPKGSVLIADQYRMALDPWPPEAMAKIYSTLDVLLNPAMGEGFGIPVLEAQSCGVPVIVTSFSAMEEVCGSGWCVACRPHWTFQNSWQARADVEDIVEALRACYAQSHSGREELARRARQHALTYDKHVVMERYWRPALAEIEHRLRNQEPITIPSRLKVAA